MRDAQDVDVLTEQTTQTTNLSPLRIAIPTAAAVVIADQLTKRWALDALELGPCSQDGNCIELFAGINFHLIFNTGAAFTQGSGFGPVLAVLAFFMSGFLLYLASRRSDRLGVALFGVVAGGALGNLVDRVFRADDGLFSGAVVDFIDVGWWPVFNVADIAIVVGVIMIIVMTFFEGSAGTDEEAGESGGESGDGDLDDEAEPAATADVASSPDQMSLDDDAESKLDRTE